MAMPIGLSTESLEEPVASYETAISCLTRLNAQNGGMAGIEATRRRSVLAGASLPLSGLVALAEFSLRAECLQPDWQGLKTLAHPLLALRKNSDVVIVTGGGRSGVEEVSVWDPHHDGVVFFVPRADFERAWSGHAVTITPDDRDPKIPESRPPSTVPVGQVSASGRPARAPQHWLSLRRCVGSIAIAAILGIGVFSLMNSAVQEVPPVSAPARVDTAATAEATPEAAVIAATPRFDATPSEPGSNAAPMPAVAVPDTILAVPPAEPAPSAETAPAEKVTEATLSVAAPVSAAPLVRSALSPAEAAALLARGDVLFREGDLAAARLFYERAADAGDGQAAIRLGETFDPVFLDHAQLRGVHGDLGIASFWYRRARDLGAAEAEILLKSMEAK
jgi:hypothetical protein